MNFELGGQGSPECKTKMKTFEKRITKKKTFEKRVYGKASKETTCQNKVLARSEQAAAWGLQRQKTMPRVVLGRT